MFIKRKLFISLAIGFAVCFAFANIGGFAKECSNIRKNVLRLHIIANSDSEADQALKIKVRDAILAQTKEIFNTDNMDAAIASAESNLDKIEEIAADVIKKEGYSYDVKAEVVNMFFDTRRYDEITMPAGRYNALRITIGNASGKNWWCVMYPPICLPAAQPKKELSDVLSPAQEDIVENEPKYEIRFKIVEIFENLKNTFFGK